MKFINYNVIGWNSLSVQEFKIIFP